MNVKSRNSSIIYFTANATKKAEIKTFDGHDNLVIPVVAALESVMNGLLYTKNEMIKSIQSWNGAPVTVNHPTTDEGVNISANSPSAMEKFNIGHFFNVVYDAGIKGEIWINIEKANKKGFSNIVETFKSGGLMEVSTGLLCEVKHESGIFNNVEYGGIVHTILPDHLALLPNEVGACSIKDGCGAMRTNCQCQGTPEVVTENTDHCKCQDDNKSIENKEGTLRKAFNFLKGKIVTNEIDHSGIREQLQGAIESVLGGNDISTNNPWVVSVTDSFFVYEIKNRLFKKSYLVQGDIVKIGDTSVEVIRQSEYKEISDNVTLNKKEINMLTKEEMIERITANKKASLLNLEQAELEELLANDVEAPELPKVDAPVEPVEAPAETVETVEDVVGNIKNPEVKAVIELAVNAQRKKKADLIADIKINSKLTEDELVGMTIPLLEKVLNSIKPSVYIGRAGAENVPIVNNGFYRPTPLKVYTAEIQEAN